MSNKNSGVRVCVKLCCYLRTRIKKKRVWIPSMADPSSIVFAELTEANIKPLRLLNASIFPLPYDDKYYRDLLKHKELTRCPPPLGGCLTFFLTLPLSQRKISLVQGWAHWGDLLSYGTSWKREEVVHISAWRSCPLQRNGNWYECSGSAQTWKFIFQTNN